MNTILSNGFIAISCGILTIMCFVVSSIKKKRNFAESDFFTNILFSLGIIFLFLTSVISMNYGRGRPAVDSFASVRMESYAVFETLRSVWIADNTYIVILQSPDKQIYIYKMSEPPPKFFKVQPTGRRYQEIKLRER